MCVYTYSMKLFHFIAFMSAEQKITGEITSHETLLYCPVAHDIMTLVMDFAISKTLTNYTDFSKINIYASVCPGKKHIRHLVGEILVSVLN